jgi:hypothetical protein
VRCCKRVDQPEYFPLHPVTCPRAPSMRTDIHSSDWILFQDFDQLDYLFLNWSMYHCIGPRGISYTFWETIFAGHSERPNEIGRLACEEDIQLTQIEDTRFYACLLETIGIPSSTQFLGKLCFSNQSFETARSGYESRLSRSDEYCFSQSISFDFDLIFGWITLNDHQFTQLDPLTIKFKSQFK